MDGPVMTLAAKPEGRSIMLIPLRSREKVWAPQRESKSMERRTYHGHALFYDFSALILIFWRETIVQAAVSFIEETQGLSTCTASVLYSSVQN